MRQEADYHIMREKRGHWRSIESSRLDIFHRNFETKASRYIHTFNHLSPLPSMLTFTYVQPYNPLSLLTPSFPSLIKAYSSSTLLPFSPPLLPHHPPSPSPHHPPTTSPPPLPLLSSAPSPPPPSISLSSSSPKPPHPPHPNSPSAPSQTPSKI